MGALSSLLVCLTISQNLRGSQVPDSAIRRCGVMGSSEGDDHWLICLPSWSSVYSLYPANQASAPICVLYL